MGLILSYLNDSTGAANYNNLAPEDCESILELTATDTDTLNYDRLTGYGRLNIDKAMKLIQKPFHKLWHFGTNSQFSFSMNKTLISTVDTIRIFEKFQRQTPLPATWFQNGKYIVKTYQITSTVNHNISNQDTIIAYRPLPISSITWPLFSNGKLLSRE